MGSSCRNPFSTARAMAPSTCMPRSCRAGGAPRPSTAPSWPATRESGVSIMRLDQGLDTGPVCLEARVAIGRDMTAGELHDALAASGADAAGARFVGARTRRARLPAASRERRDLRREDRPGRDAHRLVAAGAGGARQDPRPVALSRRLVRGRDRRQARADQGAALDLGRGVGRARRQLLDDHLTIACGEGAVRLTEVQRAGKKTMTGRRIPPRRSRFAPAWCCADPPCPATSSYSNMTARPLSAGSSRRTARRCRAVWRKRSRPSPARRPSRAGRDAPMPACTR